MTHIYPSRTADISLTTGLGPFSVSGLAPAENMRTFNEVLVIGDTVYLGVAHRDRDEWEEGLYTYVGTDRFSRTQIFQSSSSNAPVNYSAGIKDVWATIPARTTQRADETFGELSNTGVAVADFGTDSPALNMTSVVVIDQFGITMTSVILAQITAVATEDHTVADHVTAAPIVVAGNIMPGTGFTIYVTARSGTLTGKYSVAWAWK